MGKAGWAAPLYVSVAWTLMISYQLFTQTAVTTISSYVNMFWPSVGAWLVSRIDMIVFIYAFAWVFLLSSAIPSVILGKERSVLVQFFVCLTLTFMGFVIQDTLTTYGGKQIDQISSLAVLFQNPFLAMGYLSIPYLLMLGFDIHSRRKQEKKREKIENATVAYLEDAAKADEGIREEEGDDIEEKFQKELGY